MRTAEVFRRGLALGLVAFVAMGADQCQGPGGAPPFEWQPQIFVTDSRSQVIARGNVIISTDDPRFDDFIAVRKDEPRKAIEAYHKVINQCERWK